MTPPKSTHSDRALKIEELSAKIHSVYCQYRLDVHGEEYWTKGDYLKLDDKIKEADRYMARFILELLEAERREAGEESSRLKGHLFLAHAMLLSGQLEELKKFLDEVTEAIRREAK